MAPHVRQIVLDAFAGAVDPYFPRALDPAIGCWFACGHLPHRIARLIETGRTPDPPTPSPSVDGPGDATPGVGGKGPG